MKVPLSTRWFLWLATAVAGFCVAQVVGLIWLEVVELVRGEGAPAEELPEIAVLLSVSGCVFILMLGVFWFISGRMMRPLRAMAESANRIGEGNLLERVEGEDAPDELGMLALTMNRAFDRYHDVVQRLERFAGYASHQLRTPLAAIRSMGEVCLQKERTPEEYRECLGDMLAAARELTEIVEKLLMMSRLSPERVRQRFHRLELGDVLSRVIESSRAALAARRIDVVWSAAHPLHVCGDEALIGQAVGNVLDNAVRFSPEGGQITVTALQRDGHAVLQVDDAGPGIPEAVRLHLCGGSQGSSWAGDCGSGRLGLAIVSEIMRIHGGRLDVQQRESGGTRVELVMPL